MMLPALDYGMIALGLGAGALAGALYFAGLAFGLRLALRRARPVAVLLPSAAVRIALLLAAGAWIAGLGLAALAGFALGFLAVRLVVTRVAARGLAPWT
jgi:F1F0 ATPase subunit 2